MGRVLLVCGPWLRCLWSVVGGRWAAHGAQWLLDEGRAEIRRGRSEGGPRPGGVVGGATGAWEQKREEEPS